MSLQTDLESAWPEFLNIAGVVVTIAGTEVPAVQTANETNRMDTPFDSPGTALETQLAFRAVDVPGLRRETPLMWAGKRWRVADISSHSASPILLATLVHEG